LVSYQTAWLKTHYPAEFMAATMSSELQNTDKIVTFIEECRAMRLTIRPPDVNEGDYMFTVNDAGEIIYGLGAIKGLGEGPVQSLREARQQKPFTDLFDFCARIDGRKVNKRAMEAMIRSGALDRIGPPSNDVDVIRSTLWSALSDAVQAAEQSAQNMNSGIGDLFGDNLLSASTSNSNQPENVYSNYQSVKPQTVRERLKGEKETLGLYLTGHPVDEYETELRQIAPTRIADLRPDRQPQQVAGLVVSMIMRKTRRGDMATIVLDDRSARMEATLFADTLKEFRDKLVKDTVLIIEGVVAHDDFKGESSLRVNSVRTLMEARKSYVRGLRVKMDAQGVARGFEKQLEKLLQPYKGGSCPLVIDYRSQSARGLIELGEHWRVYPEEELLLKLRDCYGQKSVSLIYSASGT